VTDPAATRVVFLDDRRRPSMVMKPGERVAAAVLRRQFIDPVIPESERWRIDPGRGTSLDHIANAIRSAEEGVMVDLTDLSTKTIDIDPTLGSLLSRRFGAIEACDWSLTPASGEGIDKGKAKRIADIVTRELKILPAPVWGSLKPAPGAGLRPLINDLAWGLWDGRAAVEKVWKEIKPTPYRPLSRVIDKFVWVHPRRISLGPRREPRLVDTYYRVQGFQEFGLDLTEVPGKFITFMPRLFREYPEREGLAPRCMYWSFFKRFSARERLVLLEIFGKPWKIVELDPDVKIDEPTLEKLDDDVESLGPSMSARLPKGAKLTIPWPHPDSGTIHQGVIEESDRQLARLVLGQTMTTEDGSSRAQGEVHERQQDLVLSKDGWAMSDCIEGGLVFDIVNFNANALRLENEDEIAAYLPQFELQTGAERDRTAELERVKIVAKDLGVEVCKDEVYEISGLRTPVKGEETIGGPQPMLGPDGLPILGPDGKPLPPGQGPGSGGGAPGQPGQPGQPPPKGGQDEDREDRKVPQRFTLGKVEGRSEADLELAQVAADRGARLTKRWVDRVLVAVDGLHTEEQINAAIENVRLPDAELRELLQEVDLRASMLGALEASDEARRLDGLREPLLLASRMGISFIRTVFREAVAWFIQKAVVTRDVFDRMRADARLRAFTIAGLQRTNLLAAAKEELERSIFEGTDLRDFRDRLDDRLNADGWTPLRPAHVETVFRNATMGAYGEGRRAQMTQPAVLRRRPYWQWIATQDDRTRDTHAAAHHVVMAANDPAWKRIGPPAGHNCRCTLRSLTEEQARQYTVVNGGSKVIRALPDDGWNESAPSIAASATLLTFDESKIKRHPKGSEGGGRFAPKDGSGSEPSKDESRQSVRTYVTKKGPNRADEDRLRDWVQRYVAQKGMGSESIFSAERLAKIASGEEKEADGLKPPQTIFTADEIKQIVTDERAAYEKEWVPRNQRTLPGMSGATARETPDVAAAQLAEERLQEFRADRAAYIEKHGGPPGSDEDLEDVDLPLRERWADDALYQTRVYEAYQERVREQLRDRDLTAREVRIAFEAGETLADDSVDRAFAAGRDTVDSLVSNGVELDEVMFHSEFSGEAESSALEAFDGESLDESDVDGLPWTSQMTAEARNGYLSQWQSHFERGARERLEELRSEYGVGEFDSQVQDFFGDETSAEDLAAIWGSEKHGIGVTVRDVTVGRSWSDGQEMIVQGDLMHEGRKVGELSRTFYRHPDGSVEVKHGYFKLNKPGLQGSGVGEAMLRQSLQAYEEMGVSSVKVSTAWVGRYTWASFGFDWDDEEAESRRSDLVWFLKKHGVDQARAKDIAAGLRHSWDFAQLDVDGIRVPASPDDEHESRPTKLGKAFLFEGETWDGTIDLSDKGSPSYQRAKQRLKLSSRSPSLLLGFDETKIRRHPKGSKGGGRFAPKGGGDEAAAAEPKEHASKAARQETAKSARRRSGAGTGIVEIDREFPPPTSAERRAWEKQQAELDRSYQENTKSISREELDAILSNAADIAGSSEGWSWRPGTGAPSSGIMVARAASENRGFSFEGSMESFDREAFASKMESWLESQAGYVLSNERLHFGGWYSKDTKRFYFDISERFDEEEGRRAIFEGARRNQEGVFRLSDFRYIPTGGTGE
jgi:SPP1 gp7 family putative phage head morphogenesis protein